MFAFAITLLIVSLEVHKSFHELMECMKFFFPFTACFVTLFAIWYGQNLFFRRFGLHDRATVILNAALMLVVLFFVYPLKFLFGAMFSGAFQIGSEHELSILFYIYSGGAATIYSLFAIMYRRVLQLSDAVAIAGRSRGKGVQPPQAEAPPLEVKDDVVSLS